MLKSFALIFILGLLAGRVSEIIKLPKIVGMLLIGIVIGPFCLNLLDEKILFISADLRKIALVIILVKAGLSLDLNDLKRVGRPAILLSFLPATFEILGFVLIGRLFFDITVSEALIIGAILGAVSPAVVVPRMVNLIENKYGTDKSIPQLILAGASLDDVFVIVLFTSFVAIETSGSFSAISLLNIPVSIVTGILGGLLSGTVLNKLFKTFKMTNTKKVIVLFGASLALMALESMLDGIVGFSGLLAVMSCSMWLKNTTGDVSVLAKPFGEIWLGFELILFVLVGAAVNIDYALNYGIKAVIVILLVLLVRSLGTYLCTLKTKLNSKERLFVVLSYLPKATVQAAIGSIPLTYGLNCGDLALSIAVVSILITAPLGAFLMDLTYKKLLVHEV